MGFIWIAIVIAALVLGFTLSRPRARAGSFFPGVHQRRFRALRRIRRRMRRRRRGRFGQL